MTEHKKTFEYCTKYENCSAPLCPLDEEVNLRVKLAEDELCSYCRRQRKQGKLYRMPEELKMFVPEKNINMLKK